jgi:hypothetical protein
MRCKCDPVATGSAKRGRTPDAERNDRLAECLNGFAFDRPVLHWKQGLVDRDYRAIVPSDGSHGLHS